MSDSHTVVIQNINILVFESTDPVLFIVHLPPEPAVRNADIRNVTDGICKLRKTYT